MASSDRFLDELKSRIRLSDMVGKVVRLKKAGRNYTGLCPFHKEKSPSFSVNDDKGFYHCFGCKKHGDAISFYQEIIEPGKSFPETIETLARQAGLEVPSFKKESSEEKNYKIGLYDILEKACQWFQSQLQKNPKALAYFQQRGIPPGQITKFRLGFAPKERGELTRFMQQQGIPLQSLIEAGLVSTGEEGSYERFIHRVIFPITDPKNQVIAFGGRTLGDNLPKYINSPETSLFKKGHLIYNDYHAKTASYQKEQLVVVEGYMDTIAFDRANIPYCVAPLGTSITAEHLHRMWQFTREPTICLDGDSAGKKAMERTALLSLPYLQPGYSLKFTFLPEGMDPDDILQTQGVEALYHLIQHTVPLSEVLFRCEQQRKSLVTPEQKADLEKRLMDLVNHIKDTGVRQYYYSFFKDKLWKLNRKNHFPGKSPTLKDHTLLSQDNTFPSYGVGSLEGCEMLLLAFAINFPSILQDDNHNNEFIHIDFINKNLEALRTSLLEFSATGEEEVTSNDIKGYLEEKGYKHYFSQLDSILHHVFPVIDKSENIILPMWDYILSCYHLAFLQQEKIHLLQENTEESMERFQAFQQQITALEKKIKAFGTT